MIQPVDYKIGDPVIINTFASPYNGYTAHVLCCLDEDRYLVGIQRKGNIDTLETTKDRSELLPYTVENYMALQARIEKRNTERRQTYYRRGY